jgi:hypothetical protein
LVFAIFSRSLIFSCFSGSEADAVIFQSTGLLHSLYVLIGVSQYGFDIHQLRMQLVQALAFFRIVFVVVRVHAGGVLHPFLRLGMQRL